MQFVDRKRVKGAGELGPAGSDGLGVLIAVGAGVVPRLGEEQPPVPRAPRGVGDSVHADADLHLPDSSPACPSTAARPLGKRDRLSRTRCRRPPMPPTRLARQPCSRDDGVPARPATATRTELLQLLVIDPQTDPLSAASSSGAAPASTPTDTGCPSTADPSAEATQGLR